jgi:hypothetical protein
VDTQAVLITKEARFFAVIKPAVPAPTTATFSLMAFILNEGFV